MDCTMTRDPNAMFWFPYVMDEALLKDLDEFKIFLTNNAPRFDSLLAETSAKQLAVQMAHNVDAIVEMESLPALCHVINGWGNSIFQRTPLLERLGAFLHTDSSGRMYTLQGHPEGDFHPWQSFAYFAMAGIDPSATIPGQSKTLVEVELASTVTQTDKWEDVGHLLFALAYLPNGTSEVVMQMDGNTYDFLSLVKRAIEAHIHGDFRVCRKFHLTEGICAAVARIPGFEQYRDVAQEFLDGQMEGLCAFGLLLHSAFDPARQDLSRVDELRTVLCIDELVENHFYFAGHLLELAAFAEINGFVLRPEYRGAIAFVANKMNGLLPRFLAKIPFKETFLHVGHYRRGVTLCSLLQKVPALQVNRNHLQQYSVDLDLLKDELCPEEVELSAAEHELFCVASPADGPRDWFGRVLDAYQAVASISFKLRGGYPHFRRMAPLSWPRSVHFELLDDERGEGCSLELHFEREQYRYLEPLMRDMAGALQKVHTGEKIEWREDWYGTKGRIRVVFSAERKPEEIAKVSTSVIEESWRLIDNALAPNMR